MSIESLRDLEVNDKKLINRRAFIQALALGALAACTPPSPASDPSQKNKGLPSDFPDSPLTPTPEVIVTPTEVKKVDRVEITHDMIKYVNTNDISASEYAQKVAQGSEVPLFIESGSGKIIVQEMTRKIRAKDASYGKWVGKDLVDRQLGFLLEPGTMVSSFMRCGIYRLPDANGEYYKKSTRFEFFFSNTNFAYILSVGGEVELLKEIPVFTGPESLVIAEAGEPLFRVIKPASIPKLNVADVDRAIDFTSNYDMWLSSHPFGKTKVDYYTADQNGNGVGSSLTLASFKKDDSGKYVGLYSPTKK